MAKHKYNPEQIIHKLREAEILLSKGLTAQQAARKIGVCEQTYYRWRQKYGGMSPEMIKQLRSLQKENKRLRTVVADQALDIAILKEAAEGNF